jgi:glycine/D-amino acid oxidase-like deaminating enzyme
MGWIDPQQPFETHLCVESLSCDGIPLVGTLPELPGVYVVTGFAGRTLNFLFAIAEHLADGIVSAKGFEPLARFSTRRFV